MPTSRRTAANARGRIWNPPLQPTAGARPTGKTANPGVTSNPCRGRCSHRPGGPYAARMPAGGMPSSRRTPRRREPPRADMESALQPTAGARPTGTIRISIANPALHQTPVGDDACTAPAGAFRRQPDRSPALGPEIVPQTLPRCMPPCQYGPNNCGLNGCPLRGGLLFCAEVCYTFGQKRGRTALQTVSTPAAAVRPAVVFQPRPHPPALAAHHRADARRARRHVGHRHGLQRRRSRHLGRFAR